MRFVGCFPDLGFKVQREMGLYDIGGLGFRV